MYTLSFIPLKVLIIGNKNFAKRNALNEKSKSKQFGNNALGYDFTFTFVDIFLSQFNVDLYLYKYSIRQYTTPFEVL